MAAERFCKKCGSRSGDGDTYCKRCGTMFAVPVAIIPEFAAPPGTTRNILLRVVGFAAAVGIGLSAYSRYGQELLAEMPTLAKGPAPTAVPPPVTPTSVPAPPALTGDPQTPDHRCCRWGRLQDHRSGNQGRPATGHHRGATGYLPGNGDDRPRCTGDWRGRARKRRHRRLVRVARDHHHQGESGTQGPDHPAGGKRRHLSGLLRAQGVCLHPCRIQRGKAHHAGDRRLRPHVTVGHRGERLRGRFQSDVSELLDP